MRVFWALIAVLVVATGGLMVMRGRGPATGATLTSQAAPAEDAGAPVEPVEPTPVPVDTGEVTEEPTETVVVDVGRGDDVGPAPEPLGDPAPLVDDLAAGAPETGAADIGDSTEPDAPADEGASALLINDRYKVTGAGTAEDPYEIGFDMLVALEQDYEPKTEGKKEIPEWIKPLDGKHVVVTGFIGFPYIAPTSDECMVMLNQWDGCCIGVPPTPYDAIEVQLAAPVDLSAGVPNYGTVRGVFRTDPYLVNGWLIGLYVMDEARLEDAGGRNQAGF